MNAVVKTSGEPGGTEFRQVKVPEIRPDEVLVKVSVASICGTDIHIYKWDQWANSRIKPPLIYGHEFGGEVVKVGEMVRSINVGDYVSGECHITCGRCNQCRTGNAHVCQNVSIFGMDQDGIFAEYAAIPESNLWKNDPKLPLKIASIQDPLGNAIHTVFSADIAGRDIAVMGCGPIGLMGVAVCKAAGAARVFAIGRENQYRIDLAKEIGADFAMSSLEDDAYKVIMEETDGKGVDAVLEMAGKPEAVSQGLKYLSIGGTISLLGLFSKPLTLDLTNDVVFKYATIKGISGRLMYDTWYRMQGLLKSGKLNLDPIITHEFSFEEFDEAMETAISGNSGKVVMYLD